MICCLLRPTCNCRSSYIGTLHGSSLFVAMSPFSIFFFTPATGTRVQWPVPSSTAMATGYWQPRETTCWSYGTFAWWRRSRHSAATRKTSIVSGLLLQCLFLRLMSDVDVLFLEVFGSASCFNSCWSGHVLGLQWMHAWSSTLHVHICV